MEERNETTPGEGSPQSSSEAHWERELIEKLATGPLREQKRSRRWSIFFKSLFFLYLVALLVMFTPEDERHIGGGKHTALVDVRGVIADDRDASADVIVGGLRDAFRDPQTAGVILRINSPGGSPVQAGYVADEIRRLRGKYPNIALYAVITDICASGGYYMASAADEIYANKASLVGSIGVLMNGFGFVGAMDKLGIERRLLTAGEHKGFLDPFSPLHEDDVTHIKTMLEEIHQQFIDVVKRGRGDRLKEDPQLFSGLIWTGEQGVELGLVDALGSASYVAREVIGQERIVDFTRKPDYLQRLASRLGTAVAQVLSRNLGVEAQNIF